MSGFTLVWICVGLFFWIVPAAVLLFSLHKSLPAECIDWRDQFAMAFWPIAVPLVWFYDIVTRRKPDDFS